MRPDGITPVAGPLSLVVSHKIEGRKMLRRRTFHECATELEEISSDFRNAYLNEASIIPDRRQEIMVSASKRGIEVLRILALAIRTDQDWSLLAPDPNQVGAIRNDIPELEVQNIISDYNYPFRELQGFQPLNLRGAMNKIAHMHPTLGSFFVSNEHHDLMLSGSIHNNFWVAVISLLDLCQLIKQLPDSELPEECQGRRMKS
jgi:hypothetical protein